MPKIGKRLQRKLTGRINAWAATPNMQKDPRAFRKPGSMRSK